MVKIKTTEEIELMRIAGKKTAELLSALGTFITPGICTMDIEDFCEHYITKILQAEPGSKGQYGYAYCCNTSVNHVVCHGMPSVNQFLKNGDIVNVDVTVRVQGYYGDSSKMFLVGKVLPYAQRLSSICQEAMYLGIRTVKPGATLGDIGSVIEKFVCKHGYSVVRDYCGHGIGAKMHEEPQVLHFGTAGTGLKLKPGMTFTIEPMVNQGGHKIKHVKREGWNIAVTADRRLSAQWEHTILVTETGYEVLTLRVEEQGII